MAILRTGRMWLGVGLSLLCLWLAVRHMPWAEVRHVLVSAHYLLVGQQALVLPFGAKYDTASALAITLTAHLVYYVPTTALGVIGLWRLGASLMHLGRVTAVGPAARKTPLGEVVP